MTLTIELPDPVAEQLNQRPDGDDFARTAALRGIVAALQQPTPKTDALAPDTDEKMKPRTGAELVALWEKHNLFGSFSHIEGDSSEFARKLREKNQRREEVQW